MLVVSLVVLGCSREEAGRAPGDNLHVTATIGMITDVARNIGGEHVEVTGLMGPGVDPHLYKATQGDLDRLTDSDLILYNGLHLEGRMADVLVRMASRVPTVQVTEYIPEDRLREPPEFEGQYDPHVWFDVELWKYAAERIRDAFIEQDPAHEAAYRANAEAYLEKLDELDAYVRDRMASIPEKHRVLVTPHDAFGYFGAAYGLDVLALQGISTAAEYGLQDVDRLLDEIIERDIRAVFVESSISPKSIEALVEGAESRGHDLAVGGELFSDAMGEAGAPEGTYIGMVRHNTDAIAEALQ